MATPLENFSLQFKDLSDSVTIRGDDLVEVSQEEAISLTDLFDNPVIEAGGSNQPASKEINVESENIDGIVQLRKSDEVIDQSSF